MKTKRNEKAFEQRVKRYLESQGIYHAGTPDDQMDVWPCGYWVKRWGGGRYIPAGLPDLQMSVCGVSVDVELKAENGVISDLQVQKITQMQRSGCVAIVLKPSRFDDFKELIETIKDKDVKDASQLLKGWHL